MADNDTFVKTLSEAVEARKNWFETSELVKLKDELRTFQQAFAALYGVFLKKRLINEDPYKQEAKIGDITIPETESPAEAERVEQLSIRLSNYDNQLDFLVNFYQFTVEFLNLERIKKIVALVKYIDWVHLTPDAPLYNTKALAEMTNQSKSGTDPLTLSLIAESTANLKQSTSATMGILKGLSDFHRESYKLNVRIAITSSMPPAEAAQVSQIRKKFASALPGTPFYPDLVDEIIQEDSAKDGPALREAVLAKLQVADAKPKTEIPAVNFKITLIEGVLGIGAVSATLIEIAEKLDENAALLASQKQGFWEKLKQLLQKMINKEPDPVIYEVAYQDVSKGTTIRDKVNFQTFRNDLDRKIKTLTGLGGKGMSMARLHAMPDEQLTSLLEKAIRTVQSVHKTLSALDEFFKKEMEGADRDKIRGIKPELATMKNAIARANQKRHEYNAQKEEEEQFKRLGVTLTPSG